MARIGIIGGGAWGTALSLVVRRTGHEAVIWAREPEIVAAINERHQNPQFLPGVRLDPEIRATSDIAEAAESDAVLLTAPAQFLRATAREVAAAAPGMPAVICAKGIERGTCALMSEIVAEVMPRSPIAALSGPTFAREVAMGLPTAVTLACADAALGEKLAGYLGSRRFRVYLSDDVVGAEVGGAVKNVLAIACGITMGRELGENARAAILTRGLAEMMRLGSAKGAKITTMMGLSGFGDLSLTCNSEQSRNTSLGVLLGRGIALEDALKRSAGVSEGVTSAEAVRDLAAKLNVDMPICHAVDAIVNRGADIDAVIAELLDRPVKDETADLPAGVDRAQHFG
jgi:glycerol-3-phosphate dehydrogenase (NAD(P)+)